MADDFRAKRRIKTSFWVKLVSTPILMFVFAMFVMPPIYDVFCEITGFNGTTGRVDSDQQYKVEKDRKIEVSFFCDDHGRFSCSI